MYICTHDKAFSLEFKTYNMEPRILKTDPNRIKTLISRREKLIELNSVNNYTQIGNPKIQKYYDCILYIRKQISNEECRILALRYESIALNAEKSSKAFRGFLNPHHGLTIKDLYNLTNPDYARN